MDKKEREGRRDGGRKKGNKKEGRKGRKTKILDFLQR